MRRRSRIVMIDTGVRLVEGGWNRLRIGNGIGRSVVLIRIGAGEGHAAQMSFVCGELPDLSD